MADDTFDIPGPIDIIIGAEIFYDLLLVGQIRVADGIPILQKSKLGWIISGRVPSRQLKTTVCNLSCNNSIQRQIEKFWLVEEVASAKIWKREELECEELFISSTKKASNGQYIVELPVREGIEYLGNTRKVSLKRFQNLERMLMTDRKLKAQYVKFLAEYEELGHMTRIPETEILNSTNATCYLPHHPVFKESSNTTKLRVVFDASANNKDGISLNDKIKCGPVLQDDSSAFLCGRSRCGEDVPKSLDK